MISFVDALFSRYADPKYSECNSCELFIIGSLSPGKSGKKDRCFFQFTPEYKGNNVHNLRVYDTFRLELESWSEGWSSQGTKNKKWRSEGGLFTHDPDWQLITWESSRENSLLFSHHFYLHMLLLMTFWSWWEWFQGSNHSFWLGSSSLSCCYLHLMSSGDVIW